VGVLELLIARILTILQAVLGRPLPIVPSDGSTGTNRERTQVRQPIYKGVVGRWYVYAEFLDPLLVKLGATTPAKA
jgi:hypothetical protein